MRCRISAQIDVEHIVGVVLADHHQSLFVSFHLGVAGVAPCHDAGDRRAVVVIRHHPIAAFPCHRTRAERHHHGHERRAPCQRMQAAGATAHATKHDDHHADSQADAAAAQCGETQHAQGVIPINRHRNGVPARSGDRQQCQAKRHQYQQRSGRLAAGAFRLRRRHRRRSGEGRRHIGRGKRCRRVHRLLKRLVWRLDGTRVLLVAGRRGTRRPRHRLAWRAGHVCSGGRVRGHRLRHILRLRRPHRPSRLNGLSRLPRPRSALLRRLPARRIRLAVHQQPEHQHGHAERQPSGAGQAQRHRGAYQRARAIPIPMAVDQLLAQDPAIRLVR